jgi:hypothetical protein
MTLEDEVWKCIRKRGDFVTFTQVGGALKIHPQKLSRSLRRLEENGLLFRTTGSRGKTPVNEYLAIDENDPTFSATILDDHGWLVAVFKWTDNKGSVSRGISVPLGELSSYLRSQEGCAVIEWPPWAERLLKAGNKAGRAGYIREKGTAGTRLGDGLRNRRPTRVRRARHAPKSELTTSELS